MAEAKKRQRDKTRIEESEGGDATLRGLAVKARAKQLEKKQKAAAVAERKEARQRLYVPSPRHAPDAPPPRVYYK